MSDSKKAMDLERLRVVENEIIPALEKLDMRFSLERYQEMAAVLRKKHNLPALQEAREALATPPPEGAPTHTQGCQECGQWDQDEDGRLMCVCSPARYARFHAPHTPDQAKCPNCGGRGRTDASGTGCICQPEQASTMDHGGVGHEPEQAHRDALAALSRAEDVLSRAAPGDYGAYLQDDCEIVLRHLTASGVPYVPEEVRQLPDEWRSVITEPLPYGPSTALIDCARQLEYALAAVPAVPPSTREAMPLIEGVLRAANHDALQHINREQLDRMYEWLMRQRSAIAAAPTDGREGYE